MYRQCSRFEAIIGPLNLLSSFRIARKKQRESDLSTTCLTTLSAALVKRVLVIS